MGWTTRPLLRIVAALLLPLLVPWLITLALWALPGDPAELICPPGLCAGTETLAASLHLDEGPLGFYSVWMSSAFQGDLGTSWRMIQGVPVAEEVWRSLPSTLGLVGLTSLGIVSFMILTAVGWLPRRADAVWRIAGVPPAVIGALLAAAWIMISFGASSYSGSAALLRLVAGALVLLVFDGTLSDAVSGTRQAFDAEWRQRYVEVAVLRGESALLNMLPNMLPALAGQLRGRILHLLSGSVAVEVVLGIEGLGDLLWAGTLSQDFSIVLGAAWAFAFMSGLLLLAQAILELGVGLWVRRAPQGVA